MAYCAPQTLTDINTECGASMGGVRIATVRNRADVASITVVDGEVTAITLDANAAEDATVLAFRDQTCQLSSEGTIDDVQGVHFYTHTLAFRFPRMSASKRMSIHALTHAETIAVVKDNNGVYWLVGNEAPCVLLPSPLAPAQPSPTPTNTCLRSRASRPSCSARSLPPPSKPSSAAPPFDASIPAALFCVWPLTFVVGGFFEL